MKISTIATVLALLAASAHAGTYSSATLGTYENMAHPTFNAYSYTSTPATPGLGYIGGWATPADIGDDKLYSVPVGTTNPTPLHWTQPSDYSGHNFADGSVPGYHVNDPTVIVPQGAQRTRWRYMYFTCLASQYTMAPDYFIHNHVCWASSIDGGQSWTFLGELIGQDNGIDATGAWSPVAILAGDHIAIFYHTNSYDQSGRQVGTKVYRKDVDPDGWSDLADAVMMNTSTGLPLDISNVFVAPQDGQWIMFGNGGVQDGFNVIDAFVSNDGYNWTPWNGSGDALFIGGGAFQVFTPEWLPTGPGTGTLTFSYNASGAACPNNWGTCKYGAEFSFRLNS